MVDKDWKFLRLPFQSGRKLLRLKHGTYCERYLDIGDLCFHDDHPGAPCYICGFQRRNEIHVRQYAQMYLSLKVVATASWCLSAQVEGGEIVAVVA